VAATHATKRRRKAADAITSVEPALDAIKAGALDDLDADLLRRRWRSVVGRPAPPHLSRQLLIRILLWREQIARVGDLDPPTLQTLAQLVVNIGEDRKPTSNSSVAHHPRAGAVLVREHAGSLHRVMVLQKGFAWNGRTFGSLSGVARAITGTNWNGRRFFGLDKPAPANKHAESSRSPKEKARRAPPNSTGESPAS
jgi:hypothetical protein